MRITAAAVCLLVVAANMAHGQTAADANRQTIQRGLVVRIALPDPNLRGSMSIEQAIRQYTAIRTYLPRPISDAQLGQVLWAGNIVMRAITRDQSTAGNAGAAFPFEMYVCGGNGVFRYDPLAHAIDRLDPTDVRLGLANAANKMDSLKQASCSIVLAVPKSGGRARTRNTIGIEAGQVIYSMGVQAQAIGLGTIGTGTFDIKMVSKFAKLNTDEEPMYVMAIGVPLEPIGTVQAPAAAATTAKMAGRALIVIASKWFDEQEFFGTLDVFTVAGVNTEVASSQLGYRRGLQQSQVRATRLLGNVDVSNYDAVVFIGGQGTTEYYRNQAALSLARAAAAQGKVVAAIGEAPYILANAGLLDANRARYYQQNSIYRMSPGESFIGAGVQTEAGIITAVSSLDTTLFARSILAAMPSGKKVSPQQYPAYQREFGRSQFGQSNKQQQPQQQTPPQQQQY